MVTSFAPIKVVDIELSQPIPSFDRLTEYMALKALVRLHGVPIGYVQVPIESGCCHAEAISQRILEQHRHAILMQVLKHGLVGATSFDDLRLEDLVDLPYPAYRGEWPLVTVAVCTRDRPADMVLCLDALHQLDYPNLDILVIDNAPTTEATKELIEQQYSQVRYVREPRPGLDWARNRALLEAKGEVVAYTDDDVVVDAGWVKAIAEVFVENPEVMAVTGLVVPYELETEAQAFFEMYGGFGRGFEQKWYRKSGDKVPWQWIGAGQFGTGANMAFRRAVFDKIGYFDPALDVGTVTNGGGDLEMFYRILKEGHTLVYEPKAVIRHRHRRDYEVLRRQISYNGIGLYSYLTCLAIAYPDELYNILYIGFWWLGWWHLRRLLLSYIHPHRFPRDLIWAEFIGVFQHIGRYQKARRNAQKIAADFPNEPTAPIIPRPYLAGTAGSSHPTKDMAIRTIELSETGQPLSDVSEYFRVRVFATWHGKLLGSADIYHVGQVIQTRRLLEALAPAIGINLFQQIQNFSSDKAWTLAQILVAERYLPQGTAQQIMHALPPEVSASIVVATYDRPDDLRNCLQCLVAQKSSRPVEIIVVDNHADSGLTAPVVAEFPGVILVTEARQGLSYARNAGIIASSGDIIATTDDDVTMPPGWLEDLLAPFSRHDVMAVTGNVLPVELETQSQKLFETYGGLGRGLQGFEVGGDWFEACPYRTVPTWDLGATANAAFRANIFKDDRVGLIDEALGAGSPTGCSEDTYIFYKLAKLGYTIVYEPDAYVWHRHRRDMESLRRQIYNYSKGHIAYHLTTLLNDGDFRVFPRFLVGLPLVYLSRIYYRLRGWSDYPISLVLLEISGNLAGPWALWQSKQRVKQLGRSRFPELMPTLAEAIVEPIESDPSSINQEMQDDTLSTLVVND